MTSTCQADYTLVKPKSTIEPFFTLPSPAKSADCASLDPVSGDPVDEGFRGRDHRRTLRAAFRRHHRRREYPIAEGGAQFFGQGGVAINLRDGENTSVFADVGIDKLLDGGYIGAGIGVWDLFHGDTIDGSVFVHGGFDINDKLQWNFEGRLFMSELGEIENNYAMMTGIRYFWRR